MNVPTLENTTEKTRKRRPKLTKADVMLLRFGLEALIDREEGKAMGFAKVHLKNFEGDCYEDLCRFYLDVGMQEPESQMRADAHALLEKLELF